MKPHFKFISLFSLSVVLLLQCSTANGTGHPPLNKKGSHEAYFAIFNNSTEQSFYDIAGAYSRYISAHPQDVTAKIEACKFFGSVSDGETITYDTASALFEIYKDELILEYPDRYDVIVFRSTTMETDSAIGQLEEYVRSNPGIVTDTMCWDLFEQLARLYSYQEQPYNSIHYGVIAERLNDTLDITMLLAEQCHKAGDDKTAITYLRKFSGRTREYSDYIQRGELLFSLAEYGMAAEMFTRAVALEKYDYARLNLSKALIELGKYDEARTVLKKGEYSEYNREDLLLTLYDLDMRYGSADSAVESYNNLRDKGFSVDPLGKYRLALFFRYPFAPWQFRDAAGILLLFLVLVLCCALPAVWIVPVHYAGLLRRAIPPEQSRWNLRDFWIISAIVFLSSAVAGIIFEYHDVIGLTGYRSRMTTAPDNHDKAWHIMLYFALTTAGCIFFIRRSDIARFWGTQWSKGRSIGAGIGWMVIVRISFAIIFYIIVFLFDIDLAQRKGYDLYRPLALDIGEYILAFKDEFGWFALMLAIGVVVPMYEELIFRGVALRSMQRYLPFAWANFLQAFFFALVHINPLAMLNAFLLGFTAGTLRNRSSSLAPGIVLHISNNLLVVFMLMLSSYLNKMIN